MLLKKKIKAKYLIGKGISPHWQLPKSGSGIPFFDLWAWRNFGSAGVTLSHRSVRYQPLTASQLTRRKSRGSGGPGRRMGSLERLVFLSTERVLSCKAPVTSMSFTEMHRVISEIKPPSTLECNQPHTVLWGRLLQTRGHHDVQNWSAQIYYFIQI